MKTFILTHILSPLLILTCLFAPAAHGEEVEDTLGLYSSWEEQSVSTGRASKPLSHTPENVTVIISKDIEALNAHTLADVLATIPGIQLENLSGPGGIAYSNVHGAKSNHVLVLVDGVALNNLADNFPDVGLVPARIIERIEIVKGAASSAWGQALGGVINVITKAPEHGRLIGGSASAGIGKRTTPDSGAELSGTSGRLGYFLSGGHLGSNGLIPKTEKVSRSAASPSAARRKPAPSPCTIRRSASATPSPTPPAAAITPRLKEYRATRCNWRYAMTIFTGCAGF
jgi:vitamin B12 transporter